MRAFYRIRLSITPDSQVELRRSDQSHGLGDDAAQRALRASDWSLEKFVKDAECAKAVEALRGKQGSGSPFPEP
jgi:hypothetical protein